MSSNMKLWALAYAKLGWPVFRITGYKTPLKGSHGHLDATTDPATIEAWWTEKPNANLAVALGDIVVIDADGPGALARLQGIMAANGGAPRTAVAQTSRGLHFYFRAPPGAHIRTRNEPRQQSGDDGIDIKAHGGWTVLPPSVNAKSRFVYKWLAPLPVAELPDWLIPALVPEERTPITFGLGPLPNHLKNLKTQDVTGQTASNLRTEYSPSEHARLISALSSIPATCGYDQFLQIGMALKELDWERSDGTSIAFDIWDQWCSQSPHYNQTGLEAKWNSFKRSGVTVGTVYHLAQQHGWNGGVPAPAASPVSEAPKGLNGHHGPVTTLPAAFLNPPQGAIFFPDTTEEGKVRATMTNAKVAIMALGVSCKYDLFHNRMLVDGELIAKWGTKELSDPVVTVLRDHIRYKFTFDPGKQQVQDAAETLCLNCMFDPVLDYLDALQWDGQPRLDGWLCRYLGTPANEYVHAVARLSLIAAVRRARKPGTKFDQIIVLEGKQGAGKSEAIRILAGPENFSDQKILDVDDRKQQELTEGVWLYEIAELVGLRRSEVEHVKAFVSRTSDRARPAYGRYMVQQPRRTVFFGSTNPGAGYLQDDTGNRRFWPVTVGRIDLDALQRDRDQLWAEAAAREATGETHVLPERLWQIAAEEQDARTEGDEWAGPIADYIQQKQLASFTILQVLADNQFLRLEAREIGQAQQNRAARVLRGLGYERYRDHRAENGRRPWRYRRPPESVVV